MPIVKEYREFFLRHIQVNSGAKPDQEGGFSLQYVITGIGNVFNRFLKGDYPSEAVNRKLFESITFKLNPEDTASMTEQGLVRVATDAEAIARIDNSVGTFTNVVKPHQLPDVVLITDGNDTVVGTPVEEGGLKLSNLTRLFGGLSWRNFKLEINRDKSIVIDGTTKKIQLDGDVASPGNSMYYGTNNVGAKGWFTPPLSLPTITYSYGSTVGITTGLPVNEYLLHQAIIGANKLASNTEEAVYEVYGQFIPPSGVNLNLYLGATLLKQFTLAHNTQAINTSIKYRIVRDIVVNQALLICEITQYGVGINLTFVTFDTITFDPTIANTINFKAETLTVSVAALPQPNSFTLFRAKLSYLKPV